MATESLPDLESLSLFLSVVELGSLSQAAGRHGVTQPAASMRIAALERQLGLELLIRTTRGSAPTNAGSVVAEWSRELVATARRMAGALDALKQTPTTASVAASLTIAEHLLPGWLARVRAERPTQRFDVVVANSTAVIDFVRTGRASLGLIESPQATPGLHRRKIGQDRLVVAVSVKHPWARRRAPIEPHHLADTALVLREQGSGTRETLRRALESCGLALSSPALALSSTAAIRTAVAAGVGPTVISELAIADDIDAHRLTVVPTTGIDMTRVLTAIWKGPIPSALSWVRSST